ncbi:hypothetical protein NEHOM01_1642 [Nematocida homosporus]|uniref:uncharacterized protein n=1 Tax=Nematocida homosporus TaxID=1912981 RepID=UPI00221FD0A8|nr:uncharacterized protein NEHOM01_1642 [Nematocida homosporus]KAI5186703.1 hypothetical protein NEHOM01_1642 [Nematocida homosporus]
MSGMSLKLLLMWLCCVMVWFGLVLGSSSDSSTNSDEMELQSSVEFWYPFAQMLLEDGPCVERDAFDLSGLDNFNSEMPEHQIQLERKRITACLELLGIIVQPLVGDRLIESRNSDGTIGWTLKMISKEDRTKMLKDMQVDELTDYLSNLTEIPGVYEVSDIYRRQALKIDVGWFYIISIFNLTSTNPNEESITYKHYLEVLKPLKKITSPDQVWIVGKSTTNVILDRLKLLLFLLRIADTPIIKLDWIDMSMAPFDVKPIYRFRPLLEDIPAKLKKNELVIKIISACNNVFWNAFFDLLGEKYDIKTKQVEAYPLVSPNANPT